MKSMWLLCVLVILFPLLFADDTDGIMFSTPEKWRKERIPFPIPFARDINYKGYEELRFAPGMLKADAEDFFSYVFLLWLEGNPQIDEKQLDDIFKKYYVGLGKAVAESRKIELPADKVKVKTQILTQKELQESKRDAFANTTFFKASLEWYEPFVTGKRMTLHFDVSCQYLEKHQHTAVFVTVSPQDKKSSIWKQLDEIHEQFLKSTNNIK